ncbi:unnamed protein product [Owenia fusiformis]|uniref:Uncharacterized protein n=1 Tax=Owenia fusiformis TaxID=6347 RepID=A0A8J1XZ38_OWEFU|nr:unnamed protein product [Owenia fusiformis]
MAFSSHLRRFDNYLEIAERDEELSKLRRDVLRLDNLIADLDNKNYKLKDEIKKINYELNISDMQNRSLKLEIERLRRENRERWWDNFDLQKQNEELRATVEAYRICPCCCTRSCSSTPSRPRTARSAPHRDI